MSIFLEILFFVCLALIGIFAIWKRLREDYAEDMLFSLGLHAFGVGLLGFVLGIVIYPAILFWSVGLGIIIGLGIGAYRLKMRFYESLDIVIVTSLWLLLIRTALVAIFVRSIKEFVFASAILICISVYYLLNGSYKSFSWYKSGKVGFAGLSVLFLLILARLLVAFIFPSMLPLASTIEKIISGVALLLILSGIIKLSIRS
jgi:hypothetical protein